MSAANSGGRSITIMYCALVALCEGVDLQAAGVAAAGIAAEFKPTPDQLGTFFSASTFGLFLGAIIGGRLRSGALIVTFVGLPILLVALAKSPAQFAVVVSAVVLLGCAVLAAQAFLYALAPLAYPTRIRV
jgi:MFS transporter, AAHS family, 3-hydroxyphenylpropionic acid transporter